MNRNLIFLICLFIFILIADLVLFITLSYYYGFFAVFFYYVLKSMLGWGWMYFLIQNSDLNISHRAHIQNAFLSGGAWREKGILIALSFTLPGIILTLSSLIVCFSSRVRQGITTIIAEQIQRKLFETLQSGMGGPFGASPFDQGGPKRMDAFNPFPHDGGDRWESVGSDYETHSDKKGSRAKNEEPVVVEIDT